MYGDGINEGGEGESADREWGWDRSGGHGGVKGLEIRRSVAERMVHV